MTTAHVCLTLRNLREVLDGKVPVGFLIQLVMSQEWLITITPDIEQQIRLLDEEIAPLQNKTKKKLDKIEDEIASTNFLIDSGIGSKADKLALRNKKKELRQRRVKLKQKRSIPTSSYCSTVVEVCGQTANRTESF